MPSRCEFLYDRPGSVYYSGDVLNGKIVLTTDKVKSVRGVYITIKGVAKVRWTERKSRHNHRTNKTEYYSVYYRGDEQYLHSQVLVEGEMDLPTGVHEYTFTTPLPPQIPSSISDEHGHVSYEVELKLDRPMRLDSIYTSSFTVIRPLNLNMDPLFLQPTVNEEEKYFCCCCCASGPMKSELRTEFSGYAPGQKINFTLLIDNEANRDVDGCTVELIQNVAYRSQTPEVKTKHVQNTISNIGLGGAIRLTKKLHKGSIQVPPLPPTTMNPADIISVSYFIKAEIETGLCSANEDLQANITIGTVPLIASATNPNSIITVQPTAPSFDSSDDGDKPPQYGSIVPPSFEEATRMNKPFIDTDADENRVQDPFVPKYPVYHNFANPSAPEDDRTRLMQESLQTSWQSPPVVPGAPQPIEQQPGLSQNNFLPYPVHPVHPFPNMAPLPESSSLSQNGEGPNIGWRS